MSKSVLISIRPEWCEKIASGEKTIEIRKTCPKLETPFKCYIYQTHPKSSLVCMVHDGDELYGEIYHGKTVFIKTHKDVSAGSRTYGAWGAVIGEFVCRNIYRFDCGYDSRYNVSGAEIGDMCMTYDQFYRYGKNRPLFGFGIYDLKIYDEPKLLSAFHRPCTAACNYFDECAGTNAEECLFPMNHAPQSWCYVDE